MDNVVFGGYFILSPIEFELMGTMFNISEFSMTPHPNALRLFTF